MSSRVDLVSELPRDLPPGALLSHGSFLINLEGKWVIVGGTRGWGRGHVDSLCVQSLC